MKKIICLAVSLLALNLTPVFGQPMAAPPTLISTPQPPPNFPRRLLPLASNTDTQTLTKFNLDFSGGTPAQLVKAIEKSTGKPLNVIIPDEGADTQLPPLKMNDVVVPQLFAALEVASRKTVAVSTGQFGINNYITQQISYGFKTADNGTDNSIWYFYVNKPTLPPMISTEKVCRFYSLEPYLNRGFTVDDITTAIQTGWKIADVIPLPELNYHKETKMLIAYGEPKELETIGQVLQTLPTSNVTVIQIDSMKQEIGDLQRKVDFLGKKISGMAPPAEKSGK